MSVILNLPFRQIQHFLTIDEINLKLSEKFFPEPDIIDHRKKKDIIKPEYPFRVIKTSVECRTDELIYSDPYDSLDTAYKRLCRIYAFMWLDDNGRKGYELCAEPDGFLSCTEYPMRGEWYHKYDSPENSGIFKNGVGLDKVSFSIPGDMQVELSVNDLCAGFTLGLSTIEEVGTFLMTHKTFDLVDYGTC